MYGKTPVGGEKEKQAEKKCADCYNSIKKQLFKCRTHGKTEQTPEK
jgi:hypothetical protein